MIDYVDEEFRRGAVDSTRALPFRVMCLLEHDIDRAAESVEGAVDVASVYNMRADVRHLPDDFVKNLRKAKLYIDRALEFTRSQAFQDLFEESNHG